MNINQVSKKYDVSKDTLRYWEKMNLFPPIPRNASGYREYGSKEQNWIFYTKALRKAGMSIERIQAFVKSYLSDMNDLKHRKQLLIDQRQELIEEMNRRKETIDYLTFKINHFEEHVMNQKQDTDKGE